MYTEVLLPAVEEGASKTERDLVDIDRMIEIKTRRDPDPFEALENTRFWPPLSLSPEQKYSMVDPIELKVAVNSRPEAIPETVQN